MLCEYLFICAINSAAVESVQDSALALHYSKRRRLGWCTGVGNCFIT